MTLPTPNLDDRRFQDLVDDAKRLVQQRCPEWTDHNVSDPGVTLIETFAYMVDILLYRLNRVPDKLYTTFLDLIDLVPLPPTAARADVTFWLAGPQPEQVIVPAGTEVSTVRDEREDPVVFSTTEDWVAPPVDVEAVATRYAGERLQDRSDALDAIDGSVPCFHTEPEVGDEFLIGLSDAVPACAVLLRFACATEGVGVNPTDPPLVWEAWDGTIWRTCEVDSDSTGGLNRGGDVVLHVPPTHVTSVLVGRRAGWLRCRVAVASADQPQYARTPRVTAVDADTIGITAECVHAERVLAETIGTAEGVPGQRMHLRRKPVVQGPLPFAVEVGDGEGWQRFDVVADFSGATPDTTCVMLDAAAGEVRFGPAVREADGSMRHHGAVPPPGATVRVPVYWSGGGRRGNVGVRTLQVLKSTIPFVERVENRRRATGGVDAETLQAAKDRAPLHLRSRGRAVTVEDYEDITRQVAPEAARVACVPDAEEPGLVRVLLVPAIEPPALFGHLLPPDSLRRRVADELDRRRPIGARVVVQAPHYQGVTVVAKIRVVQGSISEEVEEAGREALQTYLDPLRGGLDGNGWPFGRAVVAGEMYAVLQRVPGTEAVDDVRLFPADPVTGKRGAETGRIELGQSSLAYSYDHQIMAYQA